MPTRIFTLLIGLFAGLLNTVPAAAQKTATPARSAVAGKSPAPKNNTKPPPASTCATDGGQPPQPVAFTLPASTFIALETTEILASDRAKKGQTIQLRVRSDVRVQGLPLIKTGAIAYGYVVDAGNNFSYNEPAYIIITADQVQTVDGSFVKLHGKPETITGENARSTVSIEPMYVLTANLMNEEKVYLSPE